MVLREIRIPEAVFAEVVECDIEIAEEGHIDSVVLLPCCFPVDIIVTDKLLLDYAYAIAAAGERTGNHHPFFGVVVVRYYRVVVEI